MAAGYATPALTGPSDVKSPPAPAATQRAGQGSPMDSPVVRYFQGDEAVAVSYARRRPDHEARQGPRRLAVHANAAKYRRSGPGTAPLGRGLGASTCAAPSTAADTGRAANSNRKLRDSQNRAGRTAAAAARGPHRCPSRRGPAHRHDMSALPAAARIRARPHTEVHVGSPGRW